MLVQLGRSTAFVLSPGMTSERLPENTYLEHVSGGWEGEEAPRRSPLPVGQNNRAGGALSCGNTEKGRPRARGLWEGAAEGEKLQFAGKLANWPGQGFLGRSPGGRGDKAAGSS